MLLSYHVASIQWITPCYKKSYEHTCNNTLARKRNVIDNTRVNNAFSSRNIVHFERDKI